MQIKTYSIPIIGGENMNEEMNVFLRSKRILQVENQVIQNDNTAFWVFCIKYIDENVSYERDKVKTDYRKTLDEKVFPIFSKLREIRKEISTEEGVPAYAVFTDEELSNIAKLDEITTNKMLTIKGIGEKKVEKYGVKFVEKMK
jgi:superfamily II DNA helicase RecQ